jgi:hypothetical protein
MSASGEEGPIDAAQILQHKIYYNAELLERPIKLLVAYRNQSLTCVCWLLADLRQARFKC